MSYAVGHKVILQSADLPSGERVTITEVLDGLEVPDGERRYHGRLPNGRELGFRGSQVRGLAPGQALTPERLAELGVDPNALSAHLGRMGTGIGTMNDLALLPGKDDEITRTTRGQMLAAQRTLQVLKENAAKSEAVARGLSGKIEALENLIREKQAIIHERNNFDRTPGAVQPFRNRLPVSSAGYARQLLRRLDDDSYELVSDGGQTVVPHGVYQFVIPTPGNSEIRVGTLGHTPMTQGGSVAFAGQLYFNHGVLERWDNDTGHYATHPGLSHQATVVQQGGRPVLPLSLFRLRGGHQAPW